MASLAGELKRRKGTFCELCNAGAAVYCEADAAFLCWSCDARVHGANFLVARHLRWIACAGCHFLDAERLLTGNGSSSPVRSLCRSCDRAACGAGSGRNSALSSAVSSASASCVSTAESVPGASTNDKDTLAVVDAGGGSGRRRAAVSEARTEGILVNWSRRLGGGRRWAEVAARVMRTCSWGMTGLPSRVCLSAALWFAMKRCGGRPGALEATAAMLRKLEMCSGVPARLIVIVESRLARVPRKRRSLEEGWAECSS